VVGRARGYLRTGGYYGRFAGARGRSAAAGTELKFHDLNHTSAVVVAARTIASPSLNGIAQGVAEDERIGRKCTLKSLSLRGTILMPAATGTIVWTDEVRVIVYQDKQCNGAAPAVLDLLETATVEGYNNLANKGRFTTLMDKKMIVSRIPASSTVAGGQFKHFNLYKKLNVPIEFNGAAGALTEIRSNNIGVLAITKNGLMELEYNVRVRYADN